MLPVDPMEEEEKWVGMIGFDLLTGGHLGEEASERGFPQSKMRGTLERSDDEGKREEEEEKKAFQNLHGGGNYGKQVS